MTRPRTWQAVRDRLEARRAALNAEIAAYPAPIPACDAQFNHLLDERKRLGAELARLETAVSGGAMPLEHFIETCPFLERPAPGRARISCSRTLK